LKRQLIKMPNVRKINENKFEVNVIEAVETNHVVTLNDDYHKELTGGNITKEELIRISFKFLLVRESNSMILKEFDLSEIEKYFPEFNAEIKNQVK